MAMYAADCTGIGYILPEHFMNRVAMTLNTVALKNLTVLSLDHDGLLKILQGEAFGMVPAVFRLGDVLADKIVWEVAGDTSGSRMMAGFLPRIVLRRHNVAVDTGLGIGAEIGKALGIFKGIGSGSGKKAEQHREYDRFFVQCHHSPDSHTIIASINTLL